MEVEPKVGKTVAGGTRGVLHERNLWVCNIVREDILILQTHKYLSEEFIQEATVLGNGLFQFWVLSRSGNGLIHSQIDQNPSVLTTSNGYIPLGNHAAR